MNLLLYRPDELGPDGVVRLSGRRARHLSEVLRVSPGQRLRAGIVRGGQGTARVEAVQRDEVTLSVAHYGPPPSRPAVAVILALPRPKVLSRVLRSVSSFGVAAIELVNAWRVEKSYFASNRLQPQRLEQDLWLGCEQGGTTWVPDVRVHPRFRPFVEDELACRLSEAPSRALVAHPRAADPIERVVPPGSKQRVVVAVGPEGGWIDSELRSFETGGFIPVRFSERVLSVESAAAALLAQLELLRRA